MKKITFLCISILFFSCDDDSNNPVAPSDCGSACTVETCAEGCACGCEGVGGDDCSCSTSCDCSTTCAGGACSSDGCATDCLCGCGGEGNCSCATDCQCGNNGGDDGGGETSTDCSEVDNSIYNISISGFAFNPSSLEIEECDVVIWTNNDSFSHTVTSDSGSELGSSTLINGSTYEHQFESEGDFPYHCNFHPSMTATITVLSFE